MFLELNQGESVEAVVRHDHFFDIDKYTARPTSSYYFEIFRVIIY